jgi:hypothetical protein
MTQYRRGTLLLALPLLHFIACVTIALAKIVSGVHYLIYVDFPLSLWDGATIIFCSGLPPLVRCGGIY